MLSIKIEKEIKHESKIVFGLTVRQVAFVALGIAAAGAVWRITNLPIDQLVLPWTIIAIIFGMFGWVHKDGMHMEDFIIKYLKRIILHNERLRYRTANAYVIMLNTGYAERRMAEGKTRRKPRKKQKSMAPYLI